MIVGIDLGTTHSLIGVMESGFPVLIADEEGRRLTPSAVWFPEGEEPVVGWPALAAQERVVTSVKRLMGARVGDATLAGHRIVASAHGGVAIVLGSQTYTPEEVSSLILAKLKHDAERAMGQAVERAVITVPAYFNEGQRAATKRAGELAGLRVERIISEPTAAALAYGLDRLAEKSRIVVYDLGGGTFDVSVLQLSEGIFEVLSTNGDTRLGGDDLDVALSDAWGLSIREAQAVKIALSGEAEVAHDGRCFSRSELEHICRPIIERTRRHCIRSLADADVRRGTMDAVVLVGGATRMPLVREMVREIFDHEPDASQHPDEAVALGATLQAGILSGSVSNMTLLDVTPLSLGIETFGGLMNVIIPRNTTIPCKAGEMFTNAATNQSAMAINVLQGEREMARDNWPLGNVVVDFPPSPKGQARVGVQFELDADGLLHVLARDTATGRDTLLKVTSAVEVSDEAVEKMLGDSLEHAFEDMDERIFTEAKIKAEEMVPAVARAIAMLGDEVSVAERTELLLLVAQTESALATRSTSQLKKALAALDLATQPLATKVLESLLAKSP